MQKNRRIRQTESVNRLLHVANHKAIGATLGYRLKNRILHLVGILILVHQDFLITICNFFCRPGGLSGITICQKANCGMFQVGEIQQLSSFFLLQIGLVELLRKPEQRLCPRRDLRQIVENGLGIRKEQFLPVFQFGPA